MSSRIPSGTVTRPGGTRIQEVPLQSRVATTEERTAFCGCCCSVPRPLLVFIVSIFYLAIAILSGVSVSEGITNHMTTYHGEVQVNSTKYNSYFYTYKVTDVSPSKDLKLWTGWLKFNDGKSTTGGKNLVDLTLASGILGFIVAFLLVASTVIAAWKFFSTIFCGARYMRGNICLALTLSLLLDIFIVAYLVVTERDMDNLAHNSLGVSPNNKIAMVPGFAWYCGFFGGLLWFFVAIFSLGAPRPVVLEYHQF